MNFEEECYNALVETHKDFFDYDKKQLKDEYACYLTQCPVCDGKNFKKYWEKDWFKFDKCEDCGFVFVNPRMNDKATYDFYNSKWINIYNKNKFYTQEAHTMDNPDVTENIYLFKWLSKNLEKDANKILEIGCGGVGAFLKEAVDKGFEATGVELGEENCNRLRTYLGNKANIIQSTLEDAKLCENYFDGASMRDVFEHIPNPKNFLREINRVLKPNGKLIIQVPNVEGLIYSIAQQTHTVVFPFEHPNYWSVKSLTKILDEVGFKVKEIEHVSLDFTLYDINDYIFGKSTFTTCFKKESCKFKKFIHKFIRNFLSIKFIRKFDLKVTPYIADKILKRGSVIRVMAEKIN